MDKFNTENKYGYFMSPTGGYGGWVKIWMKIQNISNDVRHDVLNTLSISKKERSCLQRYVVKDECQTRPNVICLSLPTI